MRRRETLSAALLCAALSLTPAPARAAVAPHDDGPPSPDGARIVDLALCLDTSGSMSGLIDSAKEKLWSIVNELGSAEPTPVLRVALVTYGNDGHLPEDGWVSLDVPLTSDLDLVSEHLFALTTNGGTEYVGRSVAYATEQLAWSNHPQTLRVVVVAGNESADQDPVRGKADVLRAASERGFHVNAIYCGNPEDGIAPGWREAAVLGSGYFATIDQDHGTVAVATPFDDELLRLNERLNASYLPFGASGAAGASNQVAQDRNAATVNAPAAAERVAAKASALYLCAWDLVDACASGQVKLEELSADELPASMRALDVSERAAFVHARSVERDAVSAQIEALQRQRQSYIAEAMVAAGLDDADAFDRVLRDAVRAQAEAAGFLFAARPALALPVGGPPAPGSGSGAPGASPRARGMPVGQTLAAPAVASSVVPEDC